jgi:ribonuclease HI
MLLSINKVLQMLAEGKSSEKISEIAGCAPEDIYMVIDRARNLLAKYEKEESRRKIIIRKKNPEYNEEFQNDDYGLSQIKNMFQSIELAPIPFSDILIVDCSSFSDDRTGESGIALILYGRDSLQVGKLAGTIRNKNKKVIPLISILRALKIGEIYKAKKLIIRTDSENSVKMINRLIIDRTESINSLLTQIDDSVKKLTEVKIEHAGEGAIQKAYYLAEKAIQDRLINKDHA